MDGGESSNLRDGKASSVLFLPTIKSYIGLTTTSETSLTPNPLPTPHNLPVASSVRPQFFDSQNSPPTSFAISYAILLTVAASTLELLFFLWMKLFLSCFEKPLSAKYRQLRSGPAR